MPPSLYLGAIDSTTALPVMQTVTLMKNDGAFHIRKVASDDPKLQIQQETVKDGSQYRLTVTYKGGWPAGAVRGNISVETDDPRQSTIEIPVTANVAAGGPAK